MRFKLDENLPEALTAVFLGAGHDAHTVGAEGLVGAKDPLVLAACLRENRALVTFDLDFADIRAYPPAEYPGLMVLRLRSQAAPHVITVLTHALPLLATEALVGHLWLIEDSQVRIR
jgi:predicted nuclease of predicted toxin-antitoxin system